MDTDLDFLDGRPDQTKGQVKRNWRDCLEDPPEHLSRVEIIGQTDNVMRALYANGKFLVSTEGQTSVAYLNPMGWRELNK